GKTHLIHSVDSVELAQEIAKRSLCNNVISDILLQVNVSGEETKHGFTVEEVRKSVQDIMSIEGIRVKGLMTMAPVQSEEGDARIVFENTKMLFDELNPGTWDTLSMGMSGDWKYAVMCGATHIRIGTALFGDRAAYAAKG
ncbi:MAG: YggS family pyridoxal phosphate-dependent enzyme, partial [Clostridiales bacterium]|nr:YggS family pyridoxal phosphate-dependent enzyme [Clostridiales bacterium]